MALLAKRKTQQEQEPDEVENEPEGDDDAAQAEALQKQQPVEMHAIATRRPVGWSSPAATVAAES